jgi:hypothetical protein
MSHAPGAAHLRRRAPPRAPRPCSGNASSTRAVKSGSGHWLSGCRPSSSSSHARAATGARRASRCCAGANAGRAPRGAATRAPLRAIIRACMLGGGRAERGGRGIRARARGGGQLLARGGRGAGPGRRLDDQLGKVAALGGPGPQWASAGVSPRTGPPGFWKALPRKSPPRLPRAPSRVRAAASIVATPPARPALACAARAAPARAAPAAPASGHAVLRALLPGSGAAGGAGRGRARARAAPTRGQPPGSSLQHRAARGAAAAAAGGPLGARPPGAAAPAGGRARRPRRPAVRRRGRRGTERPRLPPAPKTQICASPVFQPVASAIARSAAGASASKAAPAPDMSSPPAGSTSEDHTWRGGVGGGEGGEAREGRRGRGGAHVSEGRGRVGCGARGLGDGGPRMAAARAGARWYGSFAGRRPLQRCAIACGPGRQAPGAAARAPNCQRPPPLEASTWPAPQSTLHPAPGPAPHALREGDVVEQRVGAHVLHPADDALAARRVLAAGGAGRRGRGKLAAARAGH